MRVRRMFSRSYWRSLGLYFIEAFRAGFAPAVHWGQDGEDVFLVDVLPEEGFYVDVGAHHPYRFSTTKLLYDRGWHGLNIDVTEAIRTAFPKRRKRDQFHFGLIGRSRQAQFFRFVEPALSTIDEQVAEARIAAGWKLQSKEILPVTPLDVVLDIHNAPETVDLLCIDVEGADLEVLETVDFDRRRVRFILIEVHTPAWSLDDHPITRYLKARQYRPVAVWLRSTLFEFHE